MAETGCINKNKKFGLEYLKGRDQLGYADRHNYIK
jgi:hypothetical protein